jgi:hypothetical protein
MTIKIAALFVQACNQGKRQGNKRILVLDIYLELAQR